MNENNGQYEAVGVTSYGFEACAVLPIVYTKVFSYLHWIESVIKEKTLLESSYELDSYEMELNEINHNF